MGRRREGMRDEVLIGNGNGQTAAYGNAKAKQDKKWGEDGFTESIIHNTRPSRLYIHSFWNIKSTGVH